VPAFKDLGTLRVGATADVAVLELREGDFEFVDNVNNKRTVGGKRKGSGNKTGFDFSRIVKSNPVSFPRQEDI